MDTGHQDDRTAARWDTRLPAKAVVAALLLIVGVSLFVHLRGLTHDLPAPGADEPYFVLPAARMAWKGDADPQWFGHPGSTVIYPLALAYRPRGGVPRGTVVRCGAVVGARFPQCSLELLRNRSNLGDAAQRRPSRCCSCSGGACSATSPVCSPRARGPWCRSRSATGRSCAPTPGACFGLASLLLCVLALDDPKPRRFALAGLAIGFAIGSRYFMVTLVPVLVAAWIVACTATARASLDGARRRARRRGRRVRAHDTVLLLGLARRGTLPPGRDGRHGHERHVRLVRQPRLLRDRRDTQRHLVGRTRVGRGRSRHRVRASRRAASLAGGVRRRLSRRHQPVDAALAAVEHPGAAGRPALRRQRRGRRRDRDRPSVPAPLRASVGTRGARGGRRDRPRRGPRGVPRRLPDARSRRRRRASSCGAG